jgi:hypothetical protein
MFGDARIPERLWERILPDPVTGCWRWVGIRPGIRRSSPGSLTRALYETGTTIETRAALRPRCSTPRCVRPEHRTPNQGVTIVKSSALVIAVSLFTAACDPTYDAVVDQVLLPRCTFSSCHAPPTIAAQLDLTPGAACGQLVNQPSCLFPDRMRVLPGHPEESFFFRKLTGEGLHEAPTNACDNLTTNQLMPYGAQMLDPEDIALVRNWIAAGALCP